MAKHPSLCIYTSVLALFLAACGSSTPGGGSTGASPTGDPASAAKFVGNWTAQAGAAEVDDCDMKSDTIPLTGTFAISLPSAGSGFIQSLSSNGCLLKWTANGNVATLSGTETCTVAGAEGGSWQATFVTGTLTLAGTSIALQDKGNGVLTIDSVNGNCSFTQSGTFNGN
jgi:hypothetical protein